MGVLLRVLVVAVGGISLSAQPIDLNDKRLSLSYGGYNFQKTFNKTTKQWSFHVTRAGRLVRTFEDREPDHEQDDGDFWWLSMSVIPAVAGAEGQVLLRMWTGGTKCCNIYWLVEVAPTLRVILDTSAYNFDDLASFHDVDGDGNMEFSFYTTKFDYFGVGYVFSPKPLAWFKYDVKLVKYVAANDLCFAETRKEIQKGKVTLRGRSWEKNPAPDNQELKQVVLDVVLAYLYAGHDAEAWAFFDREYPKREKAQHKINIKRRVQSDPFFQAIRRRMQAATP
jgi:hypothetical protein